MPLGVAAIPRGWSRRCDEFRFDEVQSGQGDRCTRGCGVRSPAEAIALAGELEVIEVRGASSARLCGRIVAGGT